MTEDTLERRCEECGDSFNLEEHGLAEGGDDEPTLCVPCDMRGRGYE